MLPRARRLAVIMLLAIVAGLVGYLGYTKCRKAKFLRDLYVVGFSTSMIGPPTEDTLHAAIDDAHRLNIDLFKDFRQVAEVGVNQFHRQRCQLPLGDGDGCRIAIQRDHPPRRSDNLGQRRRVSAAAESAVEQHRTATRREPVDDLVQQDRHMGR